MTQAQDKRVDPLNLGGGWASSAGLGTWSSCPRRRRGAPLYKRWYRYGPKADYEPPRKQPRQQHGPGSWVQPPRGPSWGVYSNWGHWRGPWRPPPLGFRKPPDRVQLIRVYGLHPFCLCCCFCSRGLWNPGWERPPGWKKRWGRRGRGLRRHPRRSFPRSPPVDLSTLLRPVNLYGWRAPGMRAPRNTTQFIMNQIYEDMRQQEKLERQQRALQEQQPQGRGVSPRTRFPGAESPRGAEEDAELPEALYNFVQNPSLVFSPDPDEGNPSPTPQLVEEEEEEKNEEEGEEEEEEEEEGEEECEEEEEGEEECEEVEEEEEECEEECEVEEYSGKEESQEEEEMDEEMDEADSVEEGEEDEEIDDALEEEEQREEENNLPLEMPLSFLIGAEEERENFINCTYLSPEQLIPKVSQEALLMVQDIDLDVRKGTEEWDGTDLRQK
ncbi:PREDICTED: coiled-coil domain-containing glutamate-rich protein 1 [Condylura cristata]|uniref:coiled-coil domain-containing glutamate-rich protein 1 n=1 Tax=Condylura cristata TaxID=143302 RepID=UPI0006436A3B|nr:PREDICTED: coiled-coil domain-containing glutamate-rich protein 1 [Condylura cristata]